MDAEISIENLRMTSVFTIFINGKNHTLWNEHDEFAIIIQHNNTLQPCDDFQDSNEDGTMNLVHVRCQQRNGRKMITTVEGIPHIYSQTRLVKKMKKFFNCNGNVNNEKDFGEVIQLQGDQRKNVKDFLVKIGLAKDSQVKLHGF